MLTGKALDVYSLSTIEDARDCDKLQKALLRKYFTELGYRERFRKAKPEGQDLPGQLIVRINNYINKWMKLSEVGKTFEDVELMVREQFTNSCPRDVSIFLKERRHINLEGLAKMAERYLDAFNEKLSTKTTVARQDVKENKFNINAIILECLIEQSTICLELSIRKFLLSVFNGNLYNCFRLWRTFNFRKESL